MLAISKASLIAIFRSPQSVFFSLFFPVVLIVIFNFIGKGNQFSSVNVAFDQKADTSNFIYQSLKQHALLHVAKGSETEIYDLLKKGRITAIIQVDTVKAASSNAKFNIHLITSSASKKDLPLLESVLRDFIHLTEKKIYANRESLAVVTQSTIAGRKYKMVDFLLPGMIGFSLIGAAVFGIAFSFYSFKETLVLKRLYSTPISKTYILLGEGLSRVIFQLLTVVFLIAFGYYLFDFTLAHGLLTAINMLVVSFLGLMVFMGFGFLITGLAKNQHVIPIYANIFMFPQFFLSGTFFPKTSFPESMQKIVGFLPLTAINDAMRNIAFEGASISSCWPQLLVLLVWAFVVYALAVKLFKWE